MQRVDIEKTNLAFGSLQERGCTDMIVLHHTGNPTDDDLSAAEIHHSHLAQGWAGIGYHYLIRKDGMIEQGRRSEAVGAHAYRYNKTSVGVSLAGNFDIGKPTAAQIASVNELVAWLCLKYGLDPQKKGVIVGHRNLNDTSCPGENLYKRLSEIRYAASSRMSM